LVKVGGATQEDSVRHTRTVQHDDQLGHSHNGHEEQHKTNHSSFLLIRDYVHQARVVSPTLQGHIQSCYVLNQQDVENERGALQQNHTAIYVTATHQQVPVVLGDIQGLAQLCEQAIDRVGYSRGTWEPGSQEILGPQAKFLAGVAPFS
jgi:hypothetical protein